MKTLYRLGALLCAALLLGGCTAGNVPAPEESSATETTVVNTTASTAPSAQTTDTTAAPTTMPSTTVPTTTVKPTTKPTTQPTTRVTTTRQRVTTEFVPGAGSTATLAVDTPVDLKGFEFTWNVHGFYYEDALSLGLERTVTDLMEMQAERVEQAYNCKVSFKVNKLDAAVFKTYIMAQKWPAHIVRVTHGGLFEEVLACGYLQAWDDIEDSPINVADARWDGHSLGVSPFDGKRYGLNYRIRNGVPVIARCLVANKSLLTVAGCDMDALYEAVFSANWTWEMFERYAKQVVSHIADTYGMTGVPQDMFEDLILSNGGGLLASVDGKAVSVADSFENAQTAAFFAKWSNTERMVYFPAEYGDVDAYYSAEPYVAYEQFLQGNTVFLFDNYFQLSQQILPRARFDFAMLPIPIGPSASGYVTSGAGMWSDALAATIKKKDLPNILTVYNALCYPVEEPYDPEKESYNTVFQTGDMQSVRVLQMLEQSMAIDFGVGIPELRDSFTHAVMMGAVWKLQSPTAAVANLKGTAQGEIEAYFPGQYPHRYSHNRY